MNTELKKFIQKFVWFIFPYVVLLIFTLIIFYKSGEIFWYNRTINSQVIEGKNFIYGAAYSNLPHCFRFSAVEIKSPKIIALGSSRVLQFRAAFFIDSISFYTAGGVFKRLEQQRAFLESLPVNKLPQSIILGLDQWWFNARYDSALKTKNDLIYNQYSWSDNWIGLNSWQQFYYDCWTGKINLKKIWGSKKQDVEWLGISARMENFGFRKDGSRAYGNIISDETISNRIKTAIDSIRNDNGLFRWTNEPDKNAVNELRTFLRFCKKNKITVTGFLPPIHSKLLNEMKKHIEHYPNFFELYNILYPVFRENGFYVYDFTVPENYGGSDAEMVDAVHGSEKLFLKLYLKLLQKDSYLNQFSDSTYLKTKLNSMNGNFDVFGNN